MTDQDQKEQFNAAKERVRGLTWGETKALRKDGIHLLKVMADETGDEQIETVVSMVFADGALDVLSHVKVQEIYTLIVEETYGLRDRQAKNSPRPDAGEKAPGPDSVSCASDQEPSA